MGLECVFAARKELQPQQRHAQHRGLVTHRGGGRLSEPRGGRRMPGRVEYDVGLDSDVEPVIRLGHESGPNGSRLVTGSAEAAGDRPVRGEEDERGRRRNDDPSALASEF